MAGGDLIGRAGVAAFGDRMDKRKLLTLSFFVQSIGVGALALVNWPIFGLNLGIIPLPVFVICFGLGFGASIPLRLSLLADYFGRRSYGSLVGITSSVNAIFGAIGPALVGLIHDISDSYHIGFSILAILLLFSIPLSITLENPSRVAARLRTIRNERD